MRFIKQHKNPFIVLVLIILMFSIKVYADLTATEGLAIDLSSAGAGTDMTISFDITELFGSRTWGDASTDVIVWTWNRDTGTDPTITFNSGSIGLQALTLTTDLAVTEGGTGASTLTDGGILLGTGASAIHALGVATNGQIPIGDGATDPVLATLTEGLAIDVTNAAGAITLAVDPTEITGGTTWDDGGEGSVIWSWNLSAGDPAITFGNGVVNISTGALQEGGVAILNNDEMDASSELAAIIDDETGTAGSIVFSNSPTFDDDILLAAAGVLITGSDGDITFLGKGDGFDESFTINIDDTENTAVVSTTTGITKFDFGAITIDADITGALTGNADTATTASGVTNATLTTALTVNTGTLTLTAAAANNSVLTIGAGAVSVSGANTGDNTVATTGDSATAFFGAGTIEHEYGGLEANISAYTGLVAITGGATAEVDSLSELTGHLADVTRIVTEAVMPVASADPDVDAMGELSVDTDGGNEPNDVVLRSIDGGNTPLQIALAQQQKSIQCTIIKPNDLADATRDALPIWSNETGMSFVITKIEAWSSTDDTTLNVEVVDADGAGNNATVDALEIATGAGPYTVTETTITAATIAANRMIFLDFDDTDDPSWVKVSICGYFLSNVD